MQSYPMGHIPPANSYKIQNLKKPNGAACPPRELNEAERNTLYPYLGLKASVQSQGRCPIPATTLPSLPTYSNLVGTQ